MVSEICVDQNVSDARLSFVAVNPGTTLAKIYREHHDYFSIPLDIDKAGAIFAFASAAVFRRPPSRIYC
jgi:hypothetical protein